MPEQDDIEQHYMYTHSSVFFLIIDEHEKVTGNLKYCCHGKINEMRKVANSLILTCKFEDI